MEHSESFLIIRPALSDEKIIIITAPSGSGKTTLVKRLLKAYSGIEFSVSACTRKPRTGEQHGRDYYFFEEEEFKSLIEADAFVEWEMVYTGKYYGTLKDEVSRIWNAGRAPLVDIDVKGAIAIQEKYPESAFSIFIQAPSLDVLRTRLEARGSENPDSLHERIDKAAYELTFSGCFDCILVNEDLELAEAELIRIVDAFLSKGLKPVRLHENNR